MAAGRISTSVSLSRGGGLGVETAQIVKNRFDFDGGIQQKGSCFTLKLCMREHVLSD